MIKVAIVGASGYVGQELNKILTRHKRIKITSLTATSAKENSKIKAFAAADVLNLCDVVFFSLPHNESMKFIPIFLKAKKKVIDLGADYRLKNITEYEKWYKAKHSDSKNLKNSVYGLPEIRRNKIKKSDFVANPGCYPTAAILALLPCFKKNIVKAGPIIIDAKSGLSGAGRRPVEGGLSEELKGNFRPYKINHHQHMPEINQELSFFAHKKVSVNFVPHLLPIFRGMLLTIYVKLSSRENLSYSRILGLYKDFYKHEPFVRVRSKGKIPQVKDVVGTNFCDIGVFFEGTDKMLVIVSAIDNLVKGAAGQAVQNMNLMCGFKETEGLLI